MFQVQNTAKVLTEKPTVSPSRDYRAGTVQGPSVKSDPYGSWNTIKQVEPQAPIDYQAPETKHASTPNVTLHNDRTRKFEAGSKKTPSLGGT